MKLVGIVTGVLILVYLYDAYQRAMNDKGKY